MNKGKIEMEKRILTIQDISCVGQCSLTVALPIISSLGIETCVLPTGLLSTHTAFKKGYTFLDLTSEMEKIYHHWEKEQIRFDCIYTGYLGNKEQINTIIAIKNKLLLNGGILIVDPVMGDNGTLYSGFNDAFPSEMKRLCSLANIIIPNLTEACLLSGIEYITKYDKYYVESILRSLSNLSQDYVILTGISFNEHELGIAILDIHLDKISYYFTKKIPLSPHGTGDIFSSCFTALIVKGKPVSECVKISAEFISKAIEETLCDKVHWYGIRFEKAIDYLIKELI